MTALMGRERTPPPHGPYRPGQGRPTRSARALIARRAGLTSRPGASPERTLRCAGRATARRELGTRPTTPTIGWKSMRNLINDEEVKEASALAGGALMKGRPA